MVMKNIGLKRHHACDCCFYSEACVVTKNTKSATTHVISTTRKLQITGASPAISLRALPSVFFGVEALIMFDAAARQISVTSRIQK
mmetsp:Transcript_6479/g.9537  ORF Transcript_6479/g.9537 Transcript_6479/m.9537 type:complete len:86 (-) Transcript_6479:615-872(-)